MELLFLSQVLPYPLDAGPKTRAYYVLRHLAQRHAVTLVSFVRPDDPPDSVVHLRQFCEEVHTVPLLRSRWQDAMALVKSQLARRSWIITRDDSQEMHALLRRLVSAQQFDTIHADQLWMAQYALEARDAAWGQKACRLVLDQHNAVYLIPRRMAGNSRNPLLRAFMTLESSRLRWYEREACAQFDRVVWVTKEDHQAVMAETFPGRMDPVPPPTIIPICVDPDEVRPILAPTGAPTCEANILFVGGMHWPPNLEGVRWFIQKVLPRVSAALPKARFVVVGKQPPPDVQQADGVDAVGFVEDLAPYFARAHAFVVPLLAGGGMRVKILDAWLRGLPVVSTAIGAEGIDYTDREDILIANQPELFANGLLDLLWDEQFARRLGSAGRKTVKQRYDWRRVYSAWDQLYDYREKEGFLSDGI